MENTKTLIKKFVTIQGFGNVPFYVKSDLGENRFEMINTKTKIAHCIDVDCQSISEIIK